MDTVTIVGEYACFKRLQLKSKYILSVRSFETWSWRARVHACVRARARVLV
jgi:hypothetical protein